MPASLNAVGPATRNARDEVKSSIWLTIGVSALSPVPSIYTGLVGKSLARSADVRIRAPPPSVTRQHISNRNGYAIIRLFSTSSVVIGVRNVARGFLAAHSRCTTDT